MSKRYVTLNAIPSNVKVRFIKSLPCLHQGKNVPPPNHQNSNKQFYECELGLGVVCKCQCNKTKCDKYEADDSTEPLV